jgi:hypothetical protein
MNYNKLISIKLLQGSLLVLLNIIFLLMFVTKLHCSGLLNTLRVDVSSFTGYPAALISLDKQTVLPLPDIETLEQKKINADLWIEPRDPEIAAFTQPRKNYGPGEPLLAVSDQLVFETLSTVPAKLTWKRSLESKAIREGLVFLVRSRSGIFYKVKVNKQTKSEIEIVYMALEHPGDIEMIILFE